jgi:16S rRNA U516 pseudouridylate synthase RsuA-like enzyme
MSRAEASKLVLHGHITVDGKTVNIVLPCQTRHDHHAKETSEFDKFKSLSKPIPSAAAKWLDTTLHR